jgi:hydroxymethylpyrimidine pyrophosphatase-like HAD family hydrolase
MMVAERFGIREGWAVAANGSSTLRLDPALPGGWEMVRQVTFNPKPALDVITRLMPQAKVAVEVVGRGYMVTGHFPPGELDGEVHVTTLEELSAMPATRVILRETDMELEPIRQVVEATHLPEVSYAIGWTGWIDLNPPGVSKASALEELRVQLGVPAEGTVAVGDGGNDISMLQWASRGVAMGDAREDVQAAADQIAPLWSDDGVAHLIEDVLSALAP